MRRGLHAGRQSSGGFSLNVFTEDEIEDIHLATLEVLERTGVFGGMDNEFAAMIKKVVAGIRVDDDLLMVEDIAKVGSSGDFLSLDSTYQHMRDQSQPQLMDRRVREEWQADGGSTLAERAAAKAREILESHQPEPVDADVAKQMCAIVEAADREKGVV